MVGGGIDRSKTTTNIKLSPAANDLIEPKLRKTTDLTGVKVSDENESQYKDTDKSRTGLLKKQDTGRQTVLDDLADLEDIMKNDK